MLLSGHVHQPGLSQPLPGLWSMQAGTAVSHRLRWGQPNSLVVLQAQAVAPSAGPQPIGVAPQQRLAHLFDDGDYTKVAVPSVPADPLKFRDTKKYVDRIKAARAQTGDRDAYQNAFGRISGHGAVIGVPNHTGQASPAALSQTVMTRSISGAPGAANSSQDLLRSCAMS